MKHLRDFGSRAQPASSGRKDCKCKDIGIYSRVEKEELKPEIAIAEAGDAARLAVAGGCPPNNSRLDR